MKNSELYQSKFIVAVLLAFLLIPGCTGVQKANQEPQVTEETIRELQPVEEIKKEPQVEEPPFVFAGEVPETLAIFPFENNSITSRERFDALSKGLSAMMGAFLIKSGASFTIVERSNIQFLIDECEISQSESTDKSTANKLGKILGAQAIAFGSFIVFEDNIHLTARIIKVETGELIMAETVTGTIKHFTEPVHKLARRIAYSFKAGGQQDIAETGSDIDAALFFSKGLDALDNGNRHEAGQLFARSIELDPAYQEQVDNVKGMNPDAVDSSGQAKKILIIISEAQSSEQSFETESVETLLARYLQGYNYQIVTSDKLVSSSNLSEEDIQGAKKRNIKKVRKTAAFYGADLIFTGPVKNHVTREELHGVKMNKAVAIISYKVFDTASGKELDMNSRKYLGIDRTGEQAKHAAFKYMARDIARITARKIPFRVSVNEQKKLAAYKEKLLAEQKELPVQAEKKASGNEKAPLVPKLRLGNEKTVAPKSRTKKPDSYIIKKNPGKSASPQIIIINPPVDRGFKVVEKKRKIIIKGMVIDSSGIKFVKINGRNADTDAKGYFSHYTSLTTGDNHFMVTAMNKRGKTATKKLVIKHPEDKTPPEIVIISPKISRGFKVVVKKKPEKIPLKVKGMAKDDSGILYVRINNEDAAVNEQGDFSGAVALNKNNKKIIVEAADTVGNEVRKEFTVTSHFSLPTSHFPKPALWGLMIGVSRYESTTVDLRYADKDALSLAQFLKTQENRMFSEVRIRTLINEQVTRASIIENISTHLGKAGPDDVVFIFLAGHGIKHRQSGSYYFVPYDADSESILSKGLRISDFEEAVNILSKNVNKVIIAMDTCHSGAVQVGLRSGDSGENLAHALRESRGRFILASAKSGEASVEDEKFKLNDSDIGHGAFTYALIKGMMGHANYDNDNYISLNELFQYVARQVPRLTDGRQHPYLRSEGTDMPFIVTK
ncbi:MAG: hypothetical protein GY795_34790 [Desulfobacterales bacterium]|nr:hypothetical protein [Desulfobacterales bacterium]